MSKNAFTEDEQGQRWFILPGDPAWPAVQILQRSGMEYLVLPATLITGRITEFGHLYEEEVPSMVSLENLGRAYGETKSSGIRKTFVRMVRLRQALEVLRDNGEEEA